MFALTFLCKYGCKKLPERVNEFSNLENLLLLCNRDGKLPSVFCDGLRGLKSTSKRHPPKRDALCVPFAFWRTRPWSWTRSVLRTESGAKKLPERVGEHTDLENLISLCNRDGKLPSYFCYPTYFQTIFYCISLYKWCFLLIPLKKLWFCDIIN